MTKAKRPKASVKRKVKRKAKRKAKRTAKRTANGKAKARGPSKRELLQAAIDALFEGAPRSKRLFGVVRRALSPLGTTLRATKSQIVFERDRGCAWVWVPSRYLSGARPPIVLSIALPRHDRSSRWKEVVEPRPGHFMHHLEVSTPEAIDDEVIEWLREAADAATSPETIATRTPPASKRNGSERRRG